MRLRLLSSRTLPASVSPLLGLQGLYFLSEFILTTQSKSFVNLPPEAHVMEDREESPPTPASV